MNDIPTTKAMRLISDSHDTVAAELEQHASSIEVESAAAAITRIRNLTDDLEGLQEAYAHLVQLEGQKSNDKKIAKTFSPEKAA